MDYLKIPLTRQNNQIFFDLKTIESRRFIRETLDLKNEDFIFRSFGFCKDNTLFYIVIDTFENEVEKEVTYRFSLTEMNEDYYITNMQKLTENEKITCDFAVISWFTLLQNDKIGLLKGLFYVFLRRKWLSTQH